MLKKVIKIIAGLLGAICLLIFVAAGWYVYNFYPRHAHEFQIGSPQATQKILIATQGSEFKNDVVERVVALYENQDAYLRIIDVSTLETITLEQWDGIAILNTSLADNIDSDVKHFLKRAGKSDLILLITTSGGGDFVPPDLHVDGITTASRLTETELLARRIYQKFKASKI